jgi:hypothetical protein
VSPLSLVQDSPVTLPAVIGGLLSLAVALFAKAVGLDRDRAFYPTVLIVVASYYLLFAAMSGSMRVVAFESLFMAAFVAAAVAGFRANPWITVAALAGHGIFDALHGHVVDNPGVPAWWPAFCLTFDVGAAAALGWLVKRPSKVATAPPAIPQLEANR